MIKAVKVLNSVSTFLFIAILLLVYAYLPISVDLNLPELGDIHKQYFFYYALTAFIGINVLLRISLNLGLRSANERLMAWSMALIFILNLYLTCMIGFVGVWNNATHIRPSTYSYLNYLGPLLLVIWVGGLIFLALRKS